MARYRIEVLVEAEEDEGDFAIYVEEVLDESLANPHVTIEDLSVYAVR